MFNRNFKIRVFSDSLRSFAAGRIVGPHESGSSCNDGQQPAEPTKPSIQDLPELEFFFRDLFVAPDAFVSMNPLDEEGRGYWLDLVAAYEKGRFDKSREMAEELAQWLDGKYLKCERLQFDDSTLSILLNGDLYSRLRPEGYALLKLLAVHKTRGAYVTADEIICAFNDLAKDKASGLACVGDFPSGSAGLKRLARAVGYLPVPLQRLIESLPGRGRRLSLDPA